MILNKLCQLEDWSIPSMADTMRRLLPDMAQTNSSYPIGYEHRKVWEYAHILHGLHFLNAIRPDAMVLSVGSGHEEPLYDLTNHVRWVFATDIYGHGAFVTDGVAPSGMLVEPDRYARCPYNRNRLVVQHMSALDLRFEADTFDVVYSFSTIEHVGDVMRAFSEMHRVLKPGGILALTTECVVNGAAQLECEGLILFSPTTLQALDHAISGFRLVEPIDLSLSAATRAAPMQLEELVAAHQSGRTIYPDVLEQYAGREYTSCALFFKKSAVQGVASN